MSSHPPVAPSDAIDSWKEIAAYLNRDVRTVMRWEQSRGMPVHRYPGDSRSAVYALRSELDSWRRSGGIHLVASGLVASGQPAAATSPASPTTPSIAVLPFANLSADKENEYFADGLADEVINALAAMNDVRVTARTSSFAFRGQEQDVREIGTKLGVQSLLEGSIQRAGSRIRISAQLVSASDGYHLWSQRYDRDLTDIFAVQDEIAAAISGALKLKVKAAAAPRKRTKDLEAYRLWLQGRRYRFGGRTLQDIIQAGNCFSQAVALDPTFAAGHVEVGQHLLYLAVLGLVPPQKVASQARAEVMKALELDEKLGEAHAALGTLRALFDFDWAGAEQAFTRALEEEPGSAFILRRHAGSVLAPLMRLEQAEAEASDALELDPLCPESYFVMALMLFFRHEFQRAEASIRTTLELGGANPFVQWVRGVIAALEGRGDEAVMNCESAVRLYGNAPMLAAGLGMIYGFTGRTAEARRALEQLEASSQTTYVSPLYRAWVHMGLGDADRALEWLGRAIDDRDPNILHLPVKPVYDRLRADPRFDDLLRRMRLLS